MTIKPTQVLHAALLVSNLAEAEAFYEGLLGLTKLDRTLSYPGAWYALGEAQIHLIVSDDPGQSASHPKWGRRPHFALTIQDLDEAIAQLRAAHCPLQLSASGRRALFTQDPDGNVIELTEQQAAG